MKKKLIIGGIVLAVVLGGAFGVQAMTGNSFNESDVDLTASQAEDTAKEEVEDLKVQKVEKEKEDGRFVYEVKGEGVDIEVDANSGEIIEIDRDDDSNEGSNADITITKEEAEEAAKQEVSGEIVSVEKDDGHYEVELKDGKTKHEVKIDGQTGEVLEVEKDEDDDE